VGCGKSPGQQKQDCANNYEEQEPLQYLM